MLIKLTEEIYVNTSNIAAVKVSIGMYGDAKLNIYFVGDKDITVNLRKEDPREHAQELIEILNK